MLASIRAETATANAFLVDFYVVGQHDDVMLEVRTARAHGRNALPWL